MRFALNQVQVMIIDSECLIDTQPKAFRCIDSMYAVAYGDRAGLPLSRKSGLTPNEERLTQALIGRFGKRGKDSLLIVTCGDKEFVFGRGPFGSLLETGWSAEADKSRHYIDVKVPRS